MTSTLAVAADLRLEVTVPGRTPVQATLRGRGRTLDLEVDDPQLFAGRGDAPAIRALADELARIGLVVRVRDAERHLVTLGDVKGPWWQRRLTGTRHIRLGSLRGAWTSARARSRATDTPLLPDSGLVPPATVLPLAPTLMRRPRRRVTTTDDPAHGGNPRLAVAGFEGQLSESVRRVLPLDDTVTTIGSGERCDIRLPQLHALHAEIRHDEADEFVLTAIDPDTRVHGERVTQRILRTGSRIDLGPWTLTFARDEHADHGRPYGGRIGGEFGRQLSQPDARSAERPR